VHTQQFDWLITDMKQERGLDVVLVQLPRTAWFEAIVACDYAAQLAEYQQRIQVAADEAGGAEFAVVDADTAGMTLEDFRDANHVNASGADKLSRYAANRWWRQ